MLCHGDERLAQATEVHVPQTVRKEIHMLVNALPLAFAFFRMETLGSIVSDASDAGAGIGTSKVRCPSLTQRVFLRRRDRDVVEEATSEFDLVCPSKQSFTFFSYRFEGPRLHSHINVEMKV